MFQSLNVWWIVDESQSRYHHNQLHTSNGLQWLPDPVKSTKNSTPTCWQLKTAIVDRLACNFMLFFNIYIWKMIANLIEKGSWINSYLLSHTPVRMLQSISNFNFFEFFNRPIPVSKVRVSRSCLYISLNREMQQFQNSPLKKYTEWNHIFIHNKNLYVRVLIN